MTDARGGQWVDSYSGPALIARGDPLGNTARFAYDAAFNRTSATDPNNNTTTMTYDARGNLLSRTAPPPLGLVETFTYNAANDLLTAQNPPVRPGHRPLHRARPARPGRRRPVRQRLRLRQQQSGPLHRQTIRADSR